MRYTVVWDPGALAELTRIWNQALDRAAVSAASNQLDYVWKHCPMRYATSYGSDWHIRWAPLEVVFSLSAPDCLVTVIQVVYAP